MGSGVWNWDSHGPAKPGLTPAIGVRRGGNPGSPHGPALLRLASRRHGERRLELGLTRPGEAGPYACHRSQALGVPGVRPRTGPPEAGGQAAWGSAAGTGDET